MRKRTAQTAPAVIAASFCSSYPDDRACAYVGAAVGSQVGLFINWRCSEGNNSGNRSDPRCDWVIAPKLTLTKNYRTLPSANLACFLKHTVPRILNFLSCRKVAACYWFKLLGKKIIYRVYYKKTWKSLLKKHHWPISPISS